MVEPAVAGSADAALLTDIAVAHEYRGRRTPAPQSFVLHPFLIRQGTHAGTFEILHGRRGVEDPKDAGHVTRAQLAELYARGLMERPGIRLRLRPAEAVYPDSLPAKKVPRACIAAGSDFDREVAAVDTAAPLPDALRAVLEGMGLTA
ncbi:MAG: hypothetical protein PGN26_07595 [Xylophilus ampelinus]